MTIARHLLFDFGGPVLYSAFELRDRAAASMGIDPGELAGGPFDPDDEAWQRRRAGALSERDYWAHEAARFELDVRGYMSHFYEPSGDHLTRPESVALIDEVLAAGRRVGLLTNDLSAFHGPEWREPISVLRRFDPLIDLSHTGYLKPDPQAYAVGIEAMGVDAGDIVYVDDHLDKAAGGEAAGLVAVWFDVTDPAASIARVRLALAG
jgi:putative hydrolase of the HAD superfamily